MSRPSAPFTPLSFSQMVHRWLKSAFCTALFISCQLDGFAQNAYWTVFGDQPVFIKRDGVRSEQTLKFIGYKDDKLFAEIEIDGRIGEMAMPISDTMADTLRFDLEETQEANELIRQERFIAANELLRPKVYPLIKFHQVPEILHQLHTPIRALLNSLISAGELAEADDLIGRLQLDKIDLRYSEIGIRLMQAQLEEKNIQGVARIARQLPKDGDYAVNISPVIDAADTLRAAGEYETVIDLYREIESAVSGAVRINIQMWLAYSLVLANRVEEASPIIDNMQEPAINDRLYSLYKLLQGSRDHRNENYTRALDVLTRGFVRAQTSYVWVPEMLYLIGDCYARAKIPRPARNVCCDENRLPVRNNFLAHGIPKRPTILTFK